MMKELMMFEQEDEEQAVPVIPWEKLVDNPSEDRPGYCFIDNEDNPFPVDGKKWLFYRVMGNEARSAEFRRQQNWKESRVQEYMRRIRRFKEKLLVLMHVSGGQPARATELLSIRHCNTTNGGRRNIFVEHGKMVFVTAYHKGYSVRRQHEDHSSIFPVRSGGVVDVLFVVVDAVSASVGDGRVRTNRSARGICGSQGPKMQNGRPNG